MATFLAMTNLDVARWQFGVTTVYHFLFVPITLGLSICVAIMQTFWYRSRNVMWLRMTKFWGKLFLINFALGVATGIVQEFQFGMNWSSYSRFVGDIFGAPLAMEGLIAFFLESTFLGVWIFGWDRLSPKLHLCSIWLAAIGTNISALFILGANSWMQNPVGYAVNQASGRAELKDIIAVLTNKVLLVTFPHTMFGAFMTAGAFILGISAWHLLRKNEVELFTKAAKFGLIVLLVASLGTAISGHAQGQIMTEVQPMKMAAAEALWDTTKGADFSLFAIGDVNNGKNKVNLAVPGGLSFLATNHFNSNVQGMNDLNRQYQQKYGPGDYRPIPVITYWTFRLMVGLGLLLALAAVVGLWFLKRDTLLKNRWFLRASIFLTFGPLLANSLGWIFTEMGRQPWLVFSLLPTRAGVSPNVSLAQVLTTMIGFTIVYAILAVIEVGLILRYAKAGPPSEDELAQAGGAGSDPIPSLVY